jgi:hypothetical protein
MLRVTEKRNYALQWRYAVLETFEICYSIFFWTTNKRQKKNSEQLFLVNDNSVWAKQVMWRNIACRISQYYCKIFLRAVYYKFFFITFLLFCFVLLSIVHFFSFLCCKICLQQFIFFAVYLCKYDIIILFTLE